MTEAENHIAAPGRFRKFLRALTRPVRFLAVSREQRAEAWPLWIACALAGLCGALVFPRIGLWWLAYLVTVPLFLAQLKLKGAARVWAVLAFGLPWHYTNLWWLHTTVYFSAIVALGLLLMPWVVSLYLLILVPAWGYVARLLPGHPLRPLVIAPAMASIWVAGEMLRSITDLAFPWNFLAHSQVTGGVAGIVQWADLAGALPISFLVALFGAQVAMLMDSLMRPPRRMHLGQRVGLATTLVLILTLDTAGTIRGKRFDIIDEFHRAQGGATLSVAIHQTNVSQDDKWNYIASPDATQESVAAAETRWAREAMGYVRYATDSTTPTLRPRLHILPEAVFPSLYFVYQREFHEMLARTARDVNADIFFGADIRMPLPLYLAQLRDGIRLADTAGPPTTFTLPQLMTVRTDAGTTMLTEPDTAMAHVPGAWIANPTDGLVLHPYGKMRLVPFGETFPVLDGVPWIVNNLLLVGSFQRGTRQVVFETSGVVHGTMICYESVFPAQAAGLARGGAQILTVITNDAWYEPRYTINAGGFFAMLFKLPVLNQLAASGPDQHFVHSILRAIETRRPVLRSAQTGISASIAASGTVRKRTEMNELAFIHDIIDLPARPLTLYSRGGDWFGWICMAIAAAATLGWWRVRRAVRRARVPGRSPAGPVPPATG